MTVSDDPMYRWNETWNIRYELKFIIDVHHLINVMNIRSNEKMCKVDFELKLD